LNEVTHYSDIEHDVRLDLSKIRKYRDIIRAETSERLSGASIRAFQLADHVAKTVAIDGSYALLYRDISLWLVVVRAVALHYAFEQLTDTSYTLERCEINEGAELVTTSKRIAEDLPPFARDLTDRIGASKGEAPRRMATCARMLREFQLANTISKNCTNTIILMDGTLNTPPIAAINTLAEETLEYCRENHNALAGISKDSNVNLFGSVATDEELLRGVDRKELLYVRPPEPKRSLSGSRGDIFFVKLHPDAPKWFRLDVISPHHDPEQLFGSIAQFAKNELCPGYPFPLAEAHMIAVELRKYPKLYDELLFRIGQEVGLHFDEIAWGRTNIEGRRKDAFHAYLDILAKRGVNP